VVLSPGRMGPWDVMKQQTSAWRLAERLTPEKLALGFTAKSLTSRPMGSSIHGRLRPENYRFLVCHQFSTPS
jgi:hypothetical protein